MTLALQMGHIDQPVQEDGFNASRAKSMDGSVKIERYSPSEVAIRVEASDSAFLVLTDTSYPGWRTYVDGKPETIYRAYGVVRAVLVAAGPHEVLFRYQPDSFRLGSVVTVVSGLIAALSYVTGTVLTSWRKRFDRKIKLFPVPRPLHCDR